MSIPIKLAMEIPTKFLHAFSALTDLDFALAHQVLEDDAYAKFYAERPKGRVLILDNSMHELGRPLEVEKLRRAAETVLADYVVAPDQLGCPEENLSWFEETLRALGDDFRIAVVMAGNTPDARKQYLRRVRSADLICLPFREDRLSWFDEQPDEFRAFKRIHLLGVNELDELRSFTARAAVDNVEWAVDTAKPIKWASAHADMSAMYNLGVSPRGAKLGSAELLNLADFNAEQGELVRRNVEFLRTFLR